MIKLIIKNNESLKLQVFIKFTVAIITMNQFFVKIEINDNNKNESNNDFKFFLDSFLYRKY